jgi:hypothetical protein
MSEYVIPAEKAVSPDGVRLEHQSPARLRETLRHYREQLNRSNLSEADAEMLRLAHAKVHAALEEHADDEDKEDE